MRLGCMQGRGLYVGVRQVAKSNQEGNWHVEIGGVTTKNYEKV